MNTDTIREFRRRLDDLERENDSAVLRDWAPSIGEGAGGGATDDDRRSCTEAVAVNLTGRRVDAGHVMYIATDQTPLDRPQLYPYASGVEDRYEDLTFRPTTFPGYDATLFNGSFTWDWEPGAVGDDDLVLLLGRHFYTDSITANQFVSPLAGYLAAISESASIPGGYSGSLRSSEFTLGSSRQRQSAIQAAWGHQLNNDATFTFKHGWPTAAVVVKNARKFSVAEVNANGGLVPGAPPDSEQAVHMNLLPTWVYEYDYTDPDWEEVGSGDYTHDMPVGSLLVECAWLSRNDDPATIPAAISGYITQDYERNSLTYERLQIRFTLISEATPYVFVAPTAALDEFTTAKYTAAVFMSDEAAQAEFPAISCNPLVGTEIDRAAPLLGNTGAAATEAAKARLDASRNRQVVIVKEGIDAGDDGTVVREGTTWCWAYRRNYTDRYLGPPPENRLRKDIYDTPDGDIYGRVGRYWRSKLAQQTAAIANSDSGIDDIDARLACIAGRSDLLYSATSGPLLVEEWGREDIELEKVDITVTLTATRLELLSNGSLRIRLDTWATSTGYSVSISKVLTVTPSNEAGNYSRDLAIDDAGAKLLDPPLYGVTGDNPTFQSLTSTADKYTATLMWNRYLTEITPSHAYWLALEDDDQESDTFVITSDPHIDFGVNTATPWHVVNPESATDEFGEVGVDIDYAAWPEAWPDPPSLVPAGTDVTDYPVGYDPYFGATRDEVEGLPQVDPRLGLQLCRVRFVNPSAADDGGCC